MKTWWRLASELAKDGQTRERAADELAESQSERERANPTRAS